MNNGDFDLVTIEVLVDGSSIPDNLAVLEIAVERGVNAIPVATVTVADGSAVEEDFVVSSSHIFQPGRRIEVKLGYDGRNQSVFRGLILRQNIKFDPDGGSSLIVTCNDDAIATTIERSSVQFHDASDSDAIVKLLNDAGLDHDVEATAPKHAQQVKGYASDWDFILSRAAANGKVVIVDDGTVRVAAPAFNQPKSSAQFGYNINSLDIELDATDQITDVVASAWDPVSQQVVKGASAEPSVNKQGDITGFKLAHSLDLPSLELHSHVPMPTAELASWADARLIRTRLARIRGTVGLPGTVELKPGDLLDLSGLGKRFNGHGYVSGIRHQVRSGEWATEIVLGLPPLSHGEATAAATAPPASGLRPGVHGLQIAKVLKIDGDPDGEGRIQIQMPLQTDGEPGIWIRPAGPYATDGAGIRFLPEVGDEIVVGFLDGDPNAPIMLGALHSSARPTPEPADETNTIKAIVSRSQMRIAFDDVRKKLTIETPGGHSITLSDDDKSVKMIDCNGNRLEMAEGGISLSSPQSISIKSSGSVEIEGTAGVTIRSSGDATMHGANATVKGGMTAELTASGTTKVTGSMVEIDGTDGVAVSHLRD